MSKILETLYLTATMSNGHKEGIELAQYRPLNVHVEHPGTRLCAGSNPQALLNFLQRVHDWSTISVVVDTM